MAYAIMRFEKHKAANIGSLAGSLAHTFRSRYTPNAEPELIINNRVLLGPEDREAVADEIRARWPEKRRKDAVGFVELFIGASPEWFREHGGDGDQERYFELAIEWLKSHYGPDNVVSVVQHNDETTPHLAAYVVPIRPDTGALSAKYFADGPQGCSELQTSFHQAAGEPVGLERGMKGSKAEHMSIRRWYEEQAQLDKRREQIEGEAADFNAKREEAKAALQEDVAAADARDEQFEAKRKAAIAEVEQREQRVAQQSAELAERRDMLDKRAAELEARAREAEVEKAKAEAAASAAAAREKAVAKREAEAAAQAERLERLRVELEARGERLAGGDAALKQRQAEIDRAGQQLRERIDAWAREREAQAERLERLRVELEARGERLTGGQATLEQRQAEIDRAGQQLRERIEALKEINDALEQKQRSVAGQEESLQARMVALEGWAAKHAPEGVEDFADAPRPLPAALRQMAGEPAADWHDQGLDDLPKLRPRRNDPSGPTF